MRSAALLGGNGSPNRSVLRRGAQKQSQKLDAFAVVGIGDFRLELPWTDADTQWLDLGVSQRHSDRYCFPGGVGPEFEKELVINHFAGLSRKFRRGDFLQGFLLGFSSGAIPDNIRMGAQVDGFIAVTDQFDVPGLFPYLCSRIDRKKIAGVPGGIFHGRVCSVSLMSMQALIFHRPEADVVGWQSGQRFYVY